MKGDRMVCLNPYCKAIFYDINDFPSQDSRNKKIKAMCPECVGSNTENVELLMQKFERKSTGKAGNPSGHNQRSISLKEKRRYNKLKKQFLQKTYKEWKTNKVVIEYEN